MNCIHKEKKSSSPLTLKTDHSYVTVCSQDNKLNKMNSINKLYLTPEREREMSIGYRGTNFIL